MGFLDNLKQNVTQRGQLFSPSLDQNFAFDVGGVDLSKKQTTIQKTSSSQTSTTFAPVTTSTKTDTYAPIDARQFTFITGSEGINVTKKESLIQSQEATSRGEPTIGTEQLSKQSQRAEQEGGSSSLFSSLFGGGLTSLLLLGGAGVGAYFLFKKK